MSNETETVLLEKIAKNRKQMASLEHKLAMARIERDVLFAQVAATKIDRQLVLLTAGVSRRRFYSRVRAVGGPME